MTVRSIDICIVKKWIFSFVILSLLTGPGFCQSKRGNIGIFGGGVGLNFNTSPPEIFLPSIPAPIYNFETPESSATMSDPDGNLLFYTNGIHVWNREHRIMPNGVNITGAVDNFYNDASQCVIIPLPKDPFLYYIITAQWQGNDLNYSLIDIRLNQGLGDVVFKQRLLYKKSTEKMCVIKHSTGKSLWLVTHEYGTNKYRSFHIDEDGLDTAYIESAVGIVHALHEYGSNAIGYMKPSHDGALIATGILGNIGTLELLQFDNTTGKVYNPIMLRQKPSEGCYGVEFSSDNSKLYSSWNASGLLIQHDLSAGSMDEIRNSGIVISGGVSGALQLGPDNKIYVAPATYVTLGNYLYLLNFPNEKGSECGMQQNAIYSKGRAVLSGLPEFIYNTVDPEIIYEKYCTDAGTIFHLINIKQFSGITWDFGDPASGENNISTDISPQHVYKKPGKYKVTINVTFPDQSIFTYSQNISILLSPTVELGKDTIVCYMSTMKLTALTDQSVTNYKWSNGNTTQSVTVNAAGKYWLQVMNSACISTDTINVKLVKPPSFALKDTLFCFDQKMHVSLKDPELQYTWSDGITGRDRSFETEGSFTVKGTNQCGLHEAKMKVGFLPRILVNLQDTLLCANQNLALDLFSPGLTYRWQDDQTDPTYMINRSGTYWVEVSNRCESVTDTINVSYVTDEPFFIPNVITPNGDEYNNEFILDERLNDAALTIINRWGETVYSTKHYKNDWSAENYAAGVYYYSIQDRCADQKFKGLIHVLK